MTDYPHDFLPVIWTCDACDDKYDEAHHTKYETVDGETICEYCLEMDHVRCDECGTIYHEDDANITCLQCGEVLDKGGE